MTFLAEMDAETGLIHSDSGLEKAGALYMQYASAKPFPHVVIDDFLPVELAQRVLDEFETFALNPTGPGQTFDRPQERAKRQHSPEKLSEPVRRLFHVFNSRPFVEVLEKITGIDGLIPDPDFLGGGLHETATGGHLSIHADFNHHKRLNLERYVRTY